MGLMGRSEESAGAWDDPAAIAHFESTVRPLLIDRCQRCHNADEAKSGLRVDSLAALVEGGDSGPAVVPGKPDESLLIEAVRQTSVLKMPPKARLTDGEIQALSQWIEQGAVWPGSPLAADATTAQNRLPMGTLTDEGMAERATHWSFRPIRDVGPPDVDDREWPANVIDRFVLAALEAAGLRPALDADRRTLIRRLSFDLLGLPPTPEEVEAFLADAGPGAYERLVDRLLGSPHFGERWARHWLDLARYAETAGHEFDYDIPYAWRYRDYVVRAFNADLPYDQFVREHLAGDLMERPRRDQATGTNESVLGTGFFLLGEGTHSPVDVREEQVRRLDNQIDVTGKTFLGLTLACARCHDHKFDPIRQTDYYALGGYFKSSRHDYPVIDPPSGTLGTLRELHRRLTATLGDVASGGTRERSGAETAAAVLFDDFDRADFGLWQASGLAFADGPGTMGYHLSAEDSLVPIEAGVAHSGRVSDRLSGTLRSTTFTIEHGFIHYLAAGRAARINLVIDGFEKIRAPIYGDLARVVDHGEDFHPITQDVRMWRGHRAYIELADGAAADFTQSIARIPDGEGWIAVDGIWFSDEAMPPTAATTRAVSPITLDPSAAPLLAEFREQERAIQAPTIGLALIDGPGEDERILVRGNSRTPGPPIPRRFLEILGNRAAETGMDMPSGSRRDELARAVLDPANPLPARVIVNRLWQHHFGRGLVPTPDDFGRMGQPPTHPELLDWLATELVRSGWSLKHVHRLIVMSRAYQMSSTLADAETEARDPGNRLWHRREPRRLEAEALRDSLLACSGRLDRRLGGPSVATYLTAYMEGRGRPAASGPLDGDGRRSLYLNVRRNFLPPFWLAFDYPTPASCMGRRNVSNVPAQALVLLNDPLVLELSARWAERSRLAGSDQSVDSRLNTLYSTAFARLPDDTERSAAVAYLGEMPGETDWAELAHALVNVKEFLFIP